MEVEREGEGAGREGRRGGGREGGRGGREREEGRGKASGEGWKNVSHLPNNIPFDLCTCASYTS